ncbi:MAG: FecR domain-containing protein [Bacteroidales bacterium]
MNKSLLIKYINGKTSFKENRDVISWIDKSEENHHYYEILLSSISGINIDTLQNTLSKDEIVDNYLNVIKKIKSAKSHNFKYYLLRSSAIAAVILLLISVLINIKQYYNIKDFNFIDKYLSNNEVTTYYTDSGIKGEIVLPDSSIVWLNSCSKIEYPTHFDTDVRRIKFSGEGFFDVRYNAECPFEVVTDKGMQIQVLGTRFNIRSYKDDNDEQAVLFKGKVKVEKKFIKDQVLYLRNVELNPSESITFVKNVMNSGIVRVDTIQIDAWRRGKIIFKDTPMLDVIKTLERWHGMEIIVKDKSIFHHTLTATFSSESMVQIMELIRFTSSIKYKIVDNRVYLSEK